MRGFGLAVMVGASVLGVLAACTGGGGGSGASGSGAGSGSSGAAGSGGSGGATSSSSSGTGGAPAYGRCAVACSTANDCPSASYICKDGACNFAGCTSKADCDSGEDCLRFETSSFCIETCSKDADCSIEGTTCIGVDLDMKKFCKGNVPPCMSDAECNDNGLCKDGECGACQSNMDCTAPKSCIF